MDEYILEHRLQLGSRSKMNFPSGVVPPEARASSQGSRGVAVTLDDSNSSTYFGVSCRDETETMTGMEGTEYQAVKVWTAQIKERNGTNLMFIGNFTSEIEAARAVDAYIVERSLKRVLNFPADRATAVATAQKTAAETTASRVSILCVCVQLYLVVFI